MLFALCASAEAQQPTKIPRIGYLTGASLTASPRREAFRQGLRELGHVEGKNIIIEWRAAEGNRDRQRALAAELVRLKVDVIVASSGGDTRAAKEATATTPIVMALELPKLSRVAVLGTSTSPGNAQVFKETEIAAGALGVKLQYLDVLAAKDIEPAFRAASKGRADAVLEIVSGSIRGGQRKEIAALAIKSRLPLMLERPDHVEAGGLMSYGVSLSDLDRRAATYVDKILKGDKPADLPVEQPTKFEFVINLKTAKQIGLTIPPNVLARADRVIR